MAQIIARKQEKEQEESAGQSKRDQLIALLTTRELYPIIALAAFFRLARLDTVVFGVDEGNMYMMARDFITHGFIPLTSNRSSVGPLFFPLFMYILLIPASISANPMLAMGFIGLLNTLGVLLTYVLTRRYFGRFAGIIAALLFATSPLTLIFSNGIWQPDIVPVLIVLFLFCVFGGLYERRKGWLFPALVLFGMLVEVHVTAIYMVLVLVAACIFAWRTLRVRDVLYAGGVLLLTLIPYLALQVKTNFVDLRGFYHAARLPAHGLDFGVLKSYRALLGPYVGSVVQRGDVLPGNPDSVMYTTPLSYLVTPLTIIHAILPWLVVLSIVVIALMILSPLPEHRRTDLKHKDGRFGWLWNWLADLWATPYRQGLLMLLLWQVVSLGLLMRHALPVYPHYFTFFLPGPFILIGIFFQRMIELARKYLPRLKFLASFALSTCALILIAAQLLCASQTLIDTVNGHFDAQAVDLNFYNMAGLQPALAQADQLAQKRHIKRIYIATSYSDASALRYLAQDLKTPMTLFDGTNCAVLPAPEAGPVVLLETPYLYAADRVVGQYSDANQIAQPWRAGGDPFKLFVLSSHHTPKPVRALSGGLLQLSNEATTYTDVAGTIIKRWLVTRWQVAGETTPAPQTTYHHDFSMKLDGVTPTDNASCTSTRMWRGDQIFGIQSLKNGITQPTTVTVQPSSYTTQPKLHHLGSLTFSVFDWRNTPHEPAMTPDGQNSFALPVR